MKIKYFIISLLTLLILPFGVKAASGSISVGGTSTAVVGNKVTVTVTLSSNTLIGSWQMSLNYDRNYLQLTGSTAEAGGTMMAASSTTGVRKKTYTFTFKTLKTGNTKVSVDSYLAYDYNDLSALSLSSGSKSIKIITQAELEASYSKNNNLKSLSVEGFTITPEFNKDTLEYNVVVPEDTKEINILAQAEDSKSSISGVGTQSVSLGSNAFPIVVKAENGSEKTYTLNVEVKDANPITVKVGDENLTLVKIKESLPIANAYSEYTVHISDYDIPAYKNENTGFILVGLKNESGAINLYIYDEENQEYKPYYEIGTNKLTIYPLTITDKLKGYSKEKIVLNDQEVEVYSYNDKSDFVIIYGINIETGEKDFYVYDKKNQIISRYDEEPIQDLNEKLTLYTYFIFGFIGLSLVMFITLIFVITKKSKKKNKNKKMPTPPEKTETTNIIEEIATEDKEDNKKDKKDQKKRNA